MSKVIVVIGDIHGDIFKVNDCIRHARKNGANIIGALQVGDFGLYDSPGWRKYRDAKVVFDAETLICHGNHENEAEYRKVCGRTDLKNIYVFNRIDFAEFFGLKILSVGGAISVDTPKEHTHILHHNSIYHEAITEWFKRGKPHVDVIVTHEAPSNSGLVPNATITERYGVTAELGSKELRDLIEAVQPAIQVNGHHHVWNNCTIRPYDSLPPDQFRPLNIPRGTECWTLPIPFCGSHFWNASSRSGYGLIHVEDEHCLDKLKFEPILMTQHVDY